MNNKTENTIINLTPAPLDVVDIKTSKTINIPFTSIAALGSAFMSDFQHFKIAGMAGKLYRAVDADNNPVKLAYKIHDKLGYSNMYETGSTPGIARMQEVNPIQYNPAMTMAAVMLVQINQKLDEIKELQQEMYTFLQDDKHSKIRGNLSFLFDTFKNFKLNWDNDSYKNSVCTKVLDIKQESIQNIFFYKEQIHRTLDEGSLLIHNKDVNEELEKYVSDFNFYRLSLYLFSFSSFIEIILTENYSCAFLNNATDTIRKYMFDYKDLYTKAFDKIYLDNQKSIQTNILKGSGAVADAVGNAIAKTRLISKTPIDEKLIEAGDALEGLNDDHSRKLLSQLENVKNDCVSPFIKNIEVLDDLMNKPREIYADENNLYLVEAN